VSAYKHRLLAWSVLLFPAVLILLYPITQDHLRAASVLSRLADPNAKGWLANYDAHPVTKEDSSFEFRGQTIPARTYIPAGVRVAPSVVVVHGMHRLGINELRLMAFAEALAAEGFVVMTPEVASLADYRVEAESADLIGTAAQALAQRLSTPKVGILGISFSGGLALVAASNPQYSDSIAWVATVGAHYDLVHVLRFFATGEAVRPDGTFDHLAAHEYGPLIVVCERPGAFFAPQDTDKASEAIKLVLADEGKKSEVLTAQMTPADQEIMQRIYHKQFDSFRQAILSRIEQDQQDLAAASPAAALGSIHVPVLLLHGSDDSVIPPTELLWLQKNTPQKYLVDALISSALTHVDVGTQSALRDRLALVHWMALLLREARTTSDAHRLRIPSGAWLAQPATTH
jgi:pimeloyl-ACP methyl ester carboxylesterase